MADFRARQRVQIHDGTNEFGVTNTTALWVRLSDGTDDLAINTDGSLNVVFTGTVTVSGVVTLGTNTSVPIGEVSVSSILPGTGANNLGKAEDAVHGSGDVGVMALAVRNDAGTALAADGDYIPLSTDTNGSLRVNISAATVEVNTVTAQSPMLTDLNTVTASGDLGVSVDTITASGIVAVNVNTNTAGTPGLVNVNTVTSDSPIRVSKDGNANAETNPLYVQVVTGVVSGIEVNAYTTTAAVAKDGTTNHDYSVTSGSVFMLKSFVVAASGAQKATLQTISEAASTTTEEIIFTSGAKPTEQIFFDPPLEVTGTCRLVLRNDDHQAMDVYSSMKGVIV